MNKITKKKFRARNREEHFANALEYFLEAVSQLTYIGERVGKFIIGLSIDLSKKESEVNKNG